MLGQGHAVTAGFAFQDAPVVLDRFGVDFSFDPFDSFVPKPTTSAQNKEAFVVEKLEDIKVMNHRDIPKAIIELFDEYATKEYLGDDFNGTRLTEGCLDRRFISRVMDTCFKCLGYGSHSVAYELDSNWVIKLNCANYSYSSNDAGFEWAQACVELTGNTFTPTVAALYQKDRQYCMVVERLVENKGRFSAPDSGCFHDLAETHYDEMDFDEYFVDMDEYPTFVLMAAMNRDHLIQLCKTFHAVAERTGGIDDLEDFNMMLRGHVPIINDPFTNSKSDALTVGKSFSWVMADA